MDYTCLGEKVLNNAKKIAAKMNHSYVGTEHLLAALCQEKIGVAGQIFVSAKVDYQKIIDTIMEQINPGIEPIPEERDGFSPRLEAVLEDAAVYAQYYHNKEIGTEHMLLGILRDTECMACRILATMEINYQQLYMLLMQVLGPDPEEMAQVGQGSLGSGAGSYLEEFSTDLTAKAREGKLDPVIGRYTEISRVIQTLSRKNKNNPCLIGEPGVGKSTIVEGLACLMATDRVPEQLKDKRLLTLDLSGMVAGTKFRGEFEERIKGVIREVQQEGNVILFMDEVHTLVGAGGAEGSLDAANILKPSLARGSFQLIGATTISEYRKYIEKDAALERRFQPIMVDAPSVEDTIEILKGIRETYEKFHGISITDEALVAAARLSDRYVSDRNLPDKAIDILDEACAKVRLGKKVIVEDQNQGESLEMLAKRREQALIMSNLSEASAIQKEYEKLQAKQNRKKRKSSQRITLGEDQVADVVSQWTRIPISKLKEKESTRLLNLSSELHKRVIGQNEAVDAVSQAIKRGRVGMKDPSRPIGSFLFLGPTGVGKTELGKALAEVLFQTQDALIRVDMSEYMESHSVAKIIGSPPGYVGHEEGGQLSERVRRNPYSVILLDEIEKAHPDVFNILLQVMDDGRITDSQGRTVDFKNTVIIMTSNAGAKAIVEPKLLGFSSETDKKQEYDNMKSGVMNEVKRIFKPEFLNRLDDTIVFHQLNDEELGKITGLLLKKMAEEVYKQRGITLTFTDTLKKHIVLKGTDRKNGARPLRRAIQTEIENPLADAVLAGEIKDGDTIRLGYRNGELSFTKGEVS